jgi:hypothetical protein
MQLVKYFKNKNTEIAFFWNIVITHYHYASNSTIVLPPHRTQSSKMPIQIVPYFRCLYYQTVYYYKFEKTHKSIFMHIKLGQKYL